MALLTARVLVQQEHAATMEAVFASVIEHHGFVFQQLTSRQASLDLKDPRPTDKCNVSGAIHSIS